MWCPDAYIFLLKWFQVKFDNLLIYHMSFWDPLLMRIAMKKLIECSFYNDFAEHRNKLSFAKRRYTDDCLNKSNCLCPHGMYILMMLMAYVKLDAFGRNITGFDLQFCWVGQL